MLKILLLIIICAAAYFRFNYDRKYVLPVVKKNEDLSSIYKWGIALLAVAIGCIFTGQSKIGFILLLLLIPFILYLNFKSNWIGFNNWKNGRK